MAWYSVEKAKSNRSVCKICRAKIPIGEKAMQKG